MEKIKSMLKTKFYITVNLAGTKNRKKFTDCLGVAAQQCTGHTLKLSLSQKGVLKIGPFDSKDNDFVLGVVAGISESLRTGLKYDSIDVHIDT